MDYSPGHHNTRSSILFSTMVDTITNNEIDMAETHNTKDYHDRDHFHCWDSEQPPCGQKIKHFECCLCQKKNPESLEEYKKSLVEKIDKAYSRCPRCEKIGTNNYGECVCSYEDKQFLTKKDIKNLIQENR